MDPAESGREGRRRTVLYVRVSARETVLFLQPLKDPLRSVPLLRGSQLVIFQDGVNYAEPRTQLGPLDRLLTLVAWRHRVLEHLPYRLSRKSKLPGYRSLTPALNTNRTPYTSVYLHLEHPSGVPGTMPSRQQLTKTRSAVANFYFAAEHHSRGALWPSPALARTMKAEGILHDSQDQIPGPANGDFRPNGFDP